MGRERYWWANYGHSVAIRGEDEMDDTSDLRDRVAPPMKTMKWWRSCEAFILIKSGRLAGKYVACGKNPVERHHRLTRARGGTILDDAGEWYHLMDLCPQHHRMADGGEARAGGLLIDGYVTTCSQCQRPSYAGPDDYLTRRYGPSVHLRCVSDREGRPQSGEDVRATA